MVKMRNTLKFEEAALALLSIYLIIKVNMQINWWWYILLFFSPDIILLGLAIKNKTGNTIYSLFHNKSVAIIIGINGLILKIDLLLLVGLIMFGHASFDRFLGFEKKLQHEIASANK